MNITDIETHILLTFDELTEEEKTEFGYINLSQQNEIRFVRCFNYVFDTFEAEFYKEKDWDAICHLTYDSGILFRFSQDHESVTVARFY